jgi:hypothetical protein
MKIPSEPKAPNSTGFVEAALQEAARYESDTVAPDSLVIGALARHGLACSRSLLLPRLVASACGLALLLGVTLWLRAPHRPLKTGVAPDPITAFHPSNKPLLPDTSAPRPRELVRATLSPAVSGLYKVPILHWRHRRHVARHYTQHPHRRLLARNNPLPTPMRRSNGMWKTETVRCEVITQTATPVWIAQRDPETAAILLAPALFQLTLQPDDVSNPTEAHIAAALIPVRFEQENTRP